MALRPLMSPGHGSFLEAIDFNGIMLGKWADKGNGISIVIM